MALLTAKTKYGLIEGLPPEECMRKGAANAAETLQYWGSW